MGLILRIFLRLMCAVLSDFLCSLLWVIYVEYCIFKHFVFSGRWNLCSNFSWESCFLLKLRTF